MLNPDILLKISSASTPARTVAPVQKNWASTTPSKQQLNPALTQVPGGSLQDEAREEVRLHARELLDRDKRKDELDLSFEVGNPCTHGSSPFRFGEGCTVHT